MSATADRVAGGSSSTTGLVARTRALTADPDLLGVAGDDGVVFVREGGDKIEARPVELGEADSKFVEIKAGLSAGERYVAENSFVVKAEMGKGEAEHD